MPLARYGVLKGTPVDRRLANGGNPHYQVRVVDDADDWRLAINVRSQDGSEVEYAVIVGFQHPLLQELDTLENGLGAVPPARRS